MSPQHECPKMYAQRCMPEEIEHRPETVEHNPETAWLGWNNSIRRTNFLLLSVLLVCGLPPTPDESGDREQVGS
ncbi:MAG: hypothetical protein MUF72_13480 [Elainella sp. Prado103]|jgi:hypothetical protein|nr:hypothetical protein [Elainella sp. Prado103]